MRDLLQELRDIKFELDMVSSDNQPAHAQAHLNAAKNKIMSMIAWGEQRLVEIADNKEAIEEAMDK